MSLTKRLNRVPYGRVLFAFVVGVIIIVLLKRTGKTSTYSVKERSYAPITAPVPVMPQAPSPWLPILVRCARVPVSLPLFFRVRWLLRRSSVSSLPKISWLARASSSPVTRSVSPRLLAAPFATLTSPFAPSPLIPRSRSRGITLPLPPTPCSVP